MSYNKKKILYLVFFGAFAVAIGAFLFWFASELGVSVGGLSLFPLLLSGISVSAGLIAIYYLQAWRESRMKRLTKIFLSYSLESEGADIAQQLSHHLESEGYKVMSVEELEPGTSITDKIRDSIDRADIMLFIAAPGEPKELDSASLELRVAAMKGTKILPIVVGDASIPGFLDDIQFLRFKRPLDKEAYRRLQEAISFVLSKEEQVIFKDPLTGVYNRRFLNIFIEEEKSAWLDLEMSIGFILVDINNFKKINDLYGHSKSDEVLKEVAHRIKDITEDGSVFRYGGDEFLIIGPETPKFETLVEQIREAVREWNDKTDIIDHRISLAIGATSWDPNTDKSIEGAIEVAERKLYEEKIKTDK